MTTKTDTQAAFEKWLGARADDPSLPHGLMRDAFCAGVEADRQGRMPSAPQDLLDTLEELVNTLGECGMTEKARALLSRYSSGQPASCDCSDKSQCWEPCGDLGHDAEHAKLSSGQPTPSVIPVPTTKAEYIALLDLAVELDKKLNIAWEDAFRAAHGQPAASAEPAVWVAADTLNSPHPKCISSLAYMSQIDHDRCREYVPLAIINHHAAPVAAQAQRHEFDDCAASPTGKHSESWFANGDCEYCKAGAQPDAPLFYAQAQPQSWEPAGPLSIECDPERFGAAPWHITDGHNHAIGATPNDVLNRFSRHLSRQAQSCNHVYEARPIDAARAAKGGGE